MIRTIVQISGMRCGMCEAHVNDAIRNALPVKKVTSSRAKGTTVILSEQPVSRDRLRQAVGAAGYIVLSAEEEIVPEKKPFSFLRKRG